MPPHVRVLSTGGTIASTGQEGGATPEKRGEELLDAVPSIEAYATVSVDQVAQRPSFDMDWETVAAVGRAAESAASDGADGVVVTHGTDTMEESAYHLDLALQSDVPVVYTGAQRRPDELGADGPANLLAAVRTAAHPRVREAGGVYVAFDEELHPARDVTKVHTSKLEAFGSPGKGPVATLTREGVDFHRAPGSRSTDLGVLESDADVEMIKSGVGVDEEPLERAIAAGADGVVVEGTGLGNTTGPLGEAVEEAVDRGVVVVVASRCLRGRVAPVYGTAGGGQTLANHGAVFAGDLPAHKARIKLALAIERAEDVSGVREAFAEEPTGAPVPE